LPQVEVFEEGRELLWRDFSYVLSPFWQGCHWFRFEAMPDGRTRLKHGTRQMGLAMPALWNAMKSTEIGYHKFNNELANEVVRRFPKAIPDTTQPAAAVPTVPPADVARAVALAAGAIGAAGGRLTAPTSAASPTNKLASKGMLTRAMVKREASGQVLIGAGSA
jgi:hypothetical protein